MHESSSHSAWCSISFILTVTFLLPAVAQGRDCQTPSTDAPVTATATSTISAPADPATTSTEPPATTHISADPPTTAAPTEPPTASTCSPSCSAGGSGWVQVANLNMSDANQNCPPGFRLVTNGPTVAPRACGRSTDCSSVTYQTYGIEYSQVCGRVYGYRENTPDPLNSDNFETSYVDGVSLTHGSPRQHIWTFAGSLVYSFFPAIGNDFFCTAQERAWVTPDTCASGCSSCTPSSPPWFCKTLPQPTTDDIELRVCGDEDISNEDTPIDRVEIYIR